MEREMVVRTIAKYCHKEECKRDVKLQFYKRNFRPYCPRNSLSLFQPTYFRDFSKSRHPKHYYPVRSNKQLKKHSTAKSSPYKYVSKSPKLNEIQQISRIHWMKVGDEHVFKPVEHPSDEEHCNNNENCNNSIVSNQKSVMKSNLDITVEKAEPNKSYLLSSLGLVQKSINSSSLDKKGISSASTESFTKTECPGHKKYNLRSRSYDSLRNVREYKKLINIVDCNPVLYPEVLSSSKTKFLSILGLAPKQIFSKETLSNFDYELKKQLLMNKPQTWYADRNLRHRKKFYNLRSLGQYKNRGNDNRNSYKTLTNKVYLPLRLSQRRLTYEGNQRNTNMKPITSKILDSSFSKDLPRSFDAVHKEFRSRISDIKKQNKVLYTSTMQGNTQRLQNFPKNHGTNKSDANQKPLKEPEVIDIASDSEEECENKDENSFVRAEKNQLKATTTKEDSQSHKKPMLISNCYASGAFQNNQFNNRLMEGVRCCCPPPDTMKPKYYFQPRNNFPSINNLYQQDQLLKPNFPYQRPYSNNTGINSSCNPIMPLTLDMSNMQQLQSRGNSNVRNCQPLKLPSAFTNFDGVSFDLNAKGNGSIGSNCSFWKPVIPRSDKEFSYHKNIHGTAINQPSSDNSFKETCQESNPSRSRGCSVDNKFISKIGGCNSLSDGFKNKNLSNTSFNNFPFQHSNMAQTSDNSSLMIDSTRFHSNVLNGEAYNNNNKTASYKTTKFDSGLFSNQDVKPIFDINLTNSNRNIDMDASNKYIETSLNTQRLNRDTITNMRTSEPNRTSMASKMNFINTHIPNFYPDVCLNTPNFAVKNTLMRPNIEGLIHEQNQMINVPKRISKPRTLRPYNIYSNNSQVHYCISNSNKNQDTSSSNAIDVNLSSQTDVMANDKNYKDNCVNKNTFTSTSDVSKDVTPGNGRSLMILPRENLPMTQNYDVTRAKVCKGNNPTLDSTDQSSHTLCSEDSSDELSKNASKKNLVASTDQRSRTLYSKDSSDELSKSASQKNQLNEWSNLSQHNKTMSGINRKRFSLASHFDIETSVENKNTSSKKLSKEKTSTFGYDVSGKSSCKVANSSGYDTNSTHVKKSPKDAVGTLSSTPQEISTHQGVEVNRKYLNQLYDTSLMTQEHLKELSKKYKIIVLNKQPRRNNTTPVYRRILPRLERNLPQGIGKPPDVVAKNNLTKLPMESSFSTYTENSTQSLEEISSTEYSSVKNSKVDKKDSTKHNIDDEMQKLVNWIGDMKSRVNPCPQVLQESMNSLNDNLERGISLIQNIRKALLNEE